jgi:hypothetical protein
MAQSVQLNFIRPGRPVENSYIESFNGRLRDEFLNVEWFTSLQDAQRKLDGWRQTYNHQRPHSALADRAPAEFAAAHRTDASRASPFRSCIGQLGTGVKGSLRRKSTPLTPVPNRPKQAGIRAKRVCESPWKPETLYQVSGVRQRPD